MAKAGEEGFRTNTVTGTHSSPGSASPPGDRPQAFGSNDQASKSPGGAGTGGGQGPLSDLHSVPQSFFV